MPTLTEHIDSREWTTGKKRSVTMHYILDGTADDLEAKTLLLASTPTEYDGLAALRGAFGDVSPTYVNPLGQPADGPSPEPFRPANWPGATGLLVKFFNRGPGILAGVDSTDALTDAMAKHSWTYFDGDSM